MILLSLYIVFCVNQASWVTLGKVYAIIMRRAGIVSLGTSEVIDKTAPFLG